MLSNPTETDDGDTVATITEHRGRFYLADQGDDLRWHGVLDERTARASGCAQVTGSRDYVCSTGCRSWARRSDAVRALKEEGCDRVLVISA